MNCRVCSTELPKEYSRCPYCGYGNEVLFTVSSDNSPEYREQLLSKIKSISVTVKVFQYNASKQAIREVERKSLFKALKGKRCSEKIIFSDEWIVHFDKSAEIEVSYNFDGQARSASVQIYPKPVSGLLHLGLHINPELRLEVYLCVDPVPNTVSPRQESKTIKAGTIDLDFSTSSKG